MGIWETLSGSRGAKAQVDTSTPSSSSDSSASSSSLTPSSSSYSTSKYDTPSVSDLSSFIANPGYDPSALHPLAGLNQDTLEYLELEENGLTDLPGHGSALPSRGWSDDLCYGTGVTYLAALTTGGAWGLAEGLARMPPGAPPKLRLNSVLNAVTRRGPFLGNSAGVIAMVYNGINSTIGYYRGKHDAANSITAGALSGMIFKSTKGVRPMLTSGAMVAGLAGIWTLTRKTLFD